MSSTLLKAGDWVVYRKQKSSPCPGPRAEDVFPASNGDEYTYTVQKYWVVQEILDDGRLRLATRRGKQHVVAADDMRLRRARWWEKWLFRSRFQAVESSANGATNSGVGTRLE